MRELQKDLDKFNELVVAWSEDNFACVDVADFAQWHYPEAIKRALAAEEEVGRLRDALEKISNLSIAENYNDVLDDLSYVIDLATDALDEISEED